MDENTSPTTPKATPSSLKKKRVLALVVTVLVIALLVLLNTIDFSTPADDTTADTVYTPSTLPDPVFYDPDYETDVLTISEYLARDREIDYTFDGQTVVLSSSYHPDDPYTTFFMRYFAALQKGNADGGFDAYYSEVYFRRHEAFSRFAPQMVYDIEIKRTSTPQTITVAESEEDEAYLGATLARFEVRYKILYNNGTFRRDIVDSDVIPQIFTLLCDKKGNVTVNAVSYIVPSTVSPSDDSDSSILPFLMPLIWLVLSILSLALSFILRRRVLLPAAASFFITFLLSIKGSLPLQLAIGLPLLALSVVAYLLLPRLIKPKAK